MKKHFLFVLACTLCCTRALAQTTAPTLFDTIMNRVCEREFRWQTNPRPSQPAFEVKLPDEAGAYNDVDLTLPSTVNWAPIVHLQRLRQLAIAYTCPESPLKGEGKLYQGICAGLQQWYDKHPRSSNWWWNQIAAPQSLGPILILMRQGPKPLPSELEQKLLQRMAADGGNPAKWTGANKMDIALHWLYQACLLGDESKLAFAVSEAFQPIQLSVKEGYPQHDYSFHQHGDQLYIGGYGDVFVFDMASVAILVRGTKYAPSASQMRLVRRFMFESVIPVIRGRYRLYNVQGRSFTRQGGTDMGDSIGNVVYMMRDVDYPEYRDLYTDALARLSETQPASYGLRPYNRHYWRSDYTLHQRPAFTVDVRLKSTLIRGNENGNGENLKGYFLSDGGMSITTVGDEYQGLFGAWDWSRIPGVTAPHLEKIPSYGSWGVFGTSRFAGGVSDGTCGATAYSYSDENTAVMTKAQKGWFFFDKGVVCLGAGITGANSDAPVGTTVNQCRLKGPVSQTVNESKDGSAHWVWHNGIGYYFPMGGDVRCEAAVRKGVWHDFNVSQSTDTVTENIFTLWVDHGLAPQNASYAYVIAPGGQKESLKAVRLYRVLANTPAMQAVREGAKGPLGIIFYQAGTFEAENLSVQTDSPCVLWLKPGKKTWQVSVADPSRTLTGLRLQLSLPAVGKHEVACSFTPSPDAYAGATLKTDITRTSPAQMKAVFDMAPWQYDK